MGYSRWNLGEFRRETDLRVPLDSKEAYEWLKAEPERWEAWLDFRCRRTHKFWLRVRDAVREVRPGWDLYVLTDLPAEVLATNVLWPGADAPDAEKISLDLLRAHGFDPRLFADDEGIVIQRVMMADMDRFYSVKWGPPWGTNPLRYRAFHEQESLASWYRMPAGSATEVYRNYWEEPFHPDGEFGPGGDGFGMRTATATPYDRSFYRPMTFALRAANVDTLVLTGWERPVLGHEHDLRRFCQAMRALPIVEPKPLKTGTASPKITAGRYGDRIGVINHTPNATSVGVTLDKRIPKGKELRDVATGAVLIDATASERDAFVIETDGYDVRTLAVD
jgi:hypothetical protein